MPLGPGMVLEASPWPYPHAAQFDAEAARFRRCVRVMVGGAEVRLWPEEYEECDHPPVVATTVFVGLDEGGEI